MEKWHDYPDAQIAARPDALAFSDDGGADWTYAQLGAAIAALEAELRAAGARPGDRVMILTENCCAAIAALFACSRIGACALPVNARQTDTELQRIVDHARPVAALFTSAASPDALAHAGRFTAREASGAFGRMHLATPFPSDPDPELQDVAVMLFTTGTTGTPKGVMLTHGNLLFGGSASAELRGMTMEDVIYGVLPITHVFGLASVVTAATCVGAPVRLEARFTVARTYRALTSGVTLFSAVPQMHALLMQYTKEQGYDRLPGGTLRYTSSGAAPLDPAWKRKAEAFYGVALQNGYGLTESTAGVCASRNGIGDPDISVGPPLPGVEVKLDETVAGGGKGVGEVLTRGAHVMKGYYRNPEATAASLQDGWLRTGDLGYFDGREHLHIAGRCKELIIHGGFNVYPPEVEAALNDHPQVIQSAVVGQMVAGDEKVVAFVQVEEGDAPSAEELRAFAAERLAGYKRPSRIVVATDLPAAPTGKILKHRLLDVFADRLE
ncbi:class I adenylate-forming enzyme family protein [Ruegeria sp. HKCCD8929]|uniref:class I adenylate-forming enzyme family protein n=1 Tax=Ruegeria sp. HKCCD8929 TaxID=2683006 RepID=UPI001488AF4D|nr:class I adenylate-forming enzyme family protein [Ruegeria sp. HKCCD8929]